MASCFLIDVILLTVIMSTFTVDASFFKQLFSAEGCGRLQKKLVTIEQGVLRGSTMISEKGKPFCAFRAIPFALPPVGRLRFQPPQPPKPWSGILHATDEPPVCKQVKLTKMFPFGQEDCLYLNVYTTRLKPLDGKLLDVMVWLYPGVFYFGSNLEFQPHYLMDRDILLVMPNHRVGAFGFLSTGDDEAPGNYGLKDQVAALRWVQENIAAFGGNASGVTIFGVSSGAASVHFHMMSPLSKGLFHRAMSLEGTAINPWARSHNPLKQAQKQARVLGCPTDNTTCLVQCLKEVDAVVLAEAIKPMFVYMDLPASGYAPVVERKTERNPEPFLTKNPLILLQEGSFERVPWMMGGSNNGLCMSVSEICHRWLYTLQLNEHLDIPRMLLMNVSVPDDRLKSVTTKILRHYMGTDVKIRERKCSQILQMMSDRLLFHGYHKSVQLHVQAGHKQIYRYNFAYKGMYSTSLVATTRNYGISHGDEIMYIFRVFGGRLPYPPNHPDLEVREFWTSAVTNFAKYGNPTPNTTGLYLVDELQWLPVVDPGSDSTHLRYLNVGQVVTSPSHVGYLNHGLGVVKLNMAEDLYKQRMQFWDSLPIEENGYPCSS